MKLLLKFLSFACLVALACSAVANEELRQLKAQLERLTDERIPLGFVYQQLPESASPRDLWPGLTWTDISSHYEGLFFRVAGGQAAPFGQVQQANIPYISAMTHCNACDFDSMKSAISIDFDQSHQTETVLSAAKFAHSVENFSDGLSFKWTAGEVRPVNKAVKIWKRTA